MNNSDLEKPILNLIEILNSKNFTLAISLAEDLIKKGNEIAVIYNVLGVSLSSMYRYNEAIDVYKKAILLEPNNEELYRNLGKAQIRLNKDEEALFAFLKAIKIKEENPDANFNIGLIYLKQNKPEESINFFKKTIKENSKFFQAYYNLGITYSLIGDLVKSAENYKLAIKINPNYTKAINNLGSVYINLKLINKAIATLEKAIEIKPNYCEALTNLGVAYMEQKEFIKALEFFEKALIINPNFSKAIVQKLFLKRVFCDWSAEDTTNHLLNIINMDEIGVTPWQLLSLEDSPQNEYLRAHKYAKKFHNQYRKKTYYKKSKIRIGYFTPDFFQHAGMINMEGIFKNYNKNKFEIIGFDYGYNNNDETHRRIKNYFDKFFYVSNLTDFEISKLANKNEIDIAIHRNGHSQNSRSNIFSYGAAPLQISFLGYPGTTGLDFIDYIVADRTVIPTTNQEFFSEKIIYLPHSYYPTYDGRKISQKKFDRSSYGIEKESFVFCCFNNSYKISTREFAIWMRLLQKVKGSYLLLLVEDDLTKKNIEKEVIKYNIELNRIKFFNYINSEDHLARHTIADLYLDTFNYNGHTSSVDSLYAGLPVITKLGNSFTSRVCASILNAFNMSDMITNTENEYESLALEIAINTNKIQELKKRVKYNLQSSNLFSTKQYVKDLENGFINAYEKKIEENIIENIYV